MKNEPNQLNKRLFKHLLQEKRDSSRIPSCLKISKNLLNVAPDIPETDYEESDEKVSNIEPSYQNIKQRDLWENACRQNNDNGVILNCAQKKMPTNTLKSALRNRPPVAEFIKEITKANAKDDVKRRQRERDRLYNDDVFTDNTEEDIVENEAQQIYREILEVVQANSPSSLPVSRGRMVGYGEHSQRPHRQSSANMRKIKHNQISI